MNYEDYTLQLTRLILANYIEYSPAQAYFFKDQQNNKWKSIDVDFPKIDSSTVFGYSCHISSELPKNKARVAEMATQLMEKQMQYRQAGDQSVEIITVEEWLMLQDLPYKELFLERMGIDRLANATEEVAQILMTYNKLYESGMDPDNAILATAKSLQDTRAGMPPMEQALPQNPGAQMMTDPTNMGEIPI
jgi:hypothetical protein